MDRERHSWWDRVIVALDQTSWLDALAWVERLRPWVTWFKVGPVAFLRHGPALIHAIHQTGARVFLDLKFHDIPSVMESALRAAYHLRVAMVNFHALSGPEALRSLAQTARPWPDRPLLIAVTVLTSHDRPPWDPTGSPATWAERLAGWALEAGFDGVVCSAGDVPAIRQKYGPDFRTVVPGVRLEAPADDQRRWTTPWDALRTGADWIVLGRALTASPDPIAVCERLNAAFYEAGGNEPVGR
ncbi:Orotidine 5'-phosphate decarboxylase [bacterium HR11]|nr:Orotidine 5'-phosphate decarboxylase [bacterium HR11]